MGIKIWQDAVESIIIDDNGRAAGVLFSGDPSST